MITVQPMGREYSITIKASAKEKLILKFRQLTYFERNKVASASTRYTQGNLSLDIGLSCFYNLKYALKEVKGLQDADGKPYKLEFEKGVDELTDNCVNELLACPLSDKLLYIASELGAAIPEKILDPVSGKPIEGVEVRPPKKSSTKKK